MRKVLLISMVLLAILAAMGFANEYPMAKQPVEHLSVAPVIMEKAPMVTENENGTMAPPLQLNSICIDSGRNGYGFASSAPKSMDFATDLFGNDWVGVAYRKFVPGDPATGIIGVAELDVTAGFDYANVAFFDYINNVSGPTIGGRYPSFLAAPEGPIPVWNQYDVAGTPTQSRAMLSFDFFGWGPNGGGFIPPEDWAKNSDPNVIHSLWLGAPDIYKDASGVYHVGSVWEIDLNSGNYTFIHGTSSDLQTWTFENASLDWDINMVPAMNVPRFAWGSNGFGVWVSTGYLASSPDQDYKLLMCTTEDYGATWSDVRRYDFSELGIPEEITADDSIYVPDPSGTGTILYVGPASVGISYDFDVTVLPNNEIHVGANISWGPEASATTYYPNGLWMGIYDIHSADKGQTWTPSRIYWHAGLLVGDSTGAYITTNELDLGYDENGNMYAAWTDRDRQKIIPTPYPHSNSNLTEHYVQDVWASMSTDGGNNWSATPLRVTNDDQNSSYGLRLSHRAKWFPGDNGKTYVVYQIADLTRPLTPPIDIMADHVQWYYMGEAKNFPPPATSIDPTQNVVVEDFALHQNYPNPFNPETNIKFDVAKRGMVELSVFNTLGQKVAELHRGVLEPGSYHTTWNAANMPSGIYMLQMKAGNHTEVRKMMLVK
ncbi:MAG: hypothetical protein Kow0037_15480 [Calditrichia bacterium]